MVFQCYIDQRGQDSMKKNQIIKVDGKKRKSDTTTPVREGKIVGVGKDYYDILWDCCVAPVRIMTTQIKETNGKIKIERNQDA